MATSPSKDKRRTLWKILVPIVMISLLVTAGLVFIQSQVGSSQQAHRLVEIRVNQVLPDFSLVKVSGDTVNISSLDSKVILINFWATWCEACMEEMPSIVKLREAFKGRGFEVVGINVDENPNSVVPRALKEFQIEFPIYKDPEGKIADLFDVHAIPLTVIIDHQRKILFVRDGGQDWNSQAVQNQLEKWLSG